MKNLTVVRYHVYQNNEKVKSFRYLSKAKRFAIAVGAEAIDKEIVRDRSSYSSHRLIPYFLEF